MQIEDLSNAPVPPIDGADQWWPFIVGISPFIVMAITGLWGAYLAIKNHNLEEDKVRAAEKAALIEKDIRDEALESQEKQEKFIESLKAEAERYSTRIKAESDMALKEYEEQSKQQSQDYARWNEFQNDLIKETKELRDECKSLRESLRQALDNILDRDKQIKQLRDELASRDNKIIEMANEINKLKSEVELMQQEIKSLEMINQNRI